MKYRFFIVFFCFLFVFSMSFPSISTTYAQTEKFCRITNDDVILFKSPSRNTNFENVFFVLPKSYFLIILNDQYDDFLQVNYDGVVGFVLKDDITYVYSAPVTPFPVGACFEISKAMRVNVFSLPNMEKELLGTISNNSKIKYYGKIFGTEAINNFGTEWYYVKFQENEQTGFGYVYAPLAQNVTIISQNDEEVLLTPPVNGNFSQIVSPELLTPNNLYIVLTLCLVGFLLFFALLIPFKISRRQKLKAKNRKINTSSNFDF